MSPLIQQISGLAGAVVVLWAFLRSNFGSLSATSLAYGLMNCVGTFLLALSVLAPFNPGVFVVEAVWSVASLGLCVRAFRAKASSKPSSKS